MTEAKTLAEHQRTTAEGDVAERVIVQDDQGKVFEVRQGNIVLIRLAENPSTGYPWEIDEVAEQVIELQGSDFSMVGRSIGGGGWRTFTFKAQSPGTAKIQLKLRREWEPEDATIDRFEVTIRVQG
jgi:inhibitor of cysteine peptidase